jgi:hypothetical protein
MLGRVYWDTGRIDHVCRSRILVRVELPSAGRWQVVKSETNLTDLARTAWQITFGEGTTVVEDGHNVCRQFGSLYISEDRERLCFYDGEIRPGEAVLKMFTVDAKVSRIVMATTGGTRRRMTARTTSTSRSRRRRSSRPTRSPRSGADSRPDTIRRDYNQAWFERIVVDDDLGQPKVTSVTRTELFEALRHAEVRGPVEAEALQTEREADTASEQDEASTTGVFEQVLARKMGGTGQKKNPGASAARVVHRAVVLTLHFWWAILGSNQ